ncbi:MAG: hypothetical protein WA419_16730 [Silvibacterium sp.]
MKLGHVDLFMIRQSEIKPAMTAPDLDTDNRHKLLSDAALFCETGTRFALNLIRISCTVTEKFGVVEMDTLKRAIDDAFEELRVHWISCAKCTRIELALLRPVGGKLPGNR